MSHAELPERVCRAMEGGKVVIDNGRFRWNKSCPGCTSAAYQKIKFALDGQGFS